MAELVALASGYDLVLLDLGAGLERTVRQMAGLACTKLIVATDEPTSLTDAYAFIKLAHMQDPQVGTGGPVLRIVINMAASPAEGARSEEHTSELQSLMRISSAVSCMKKK